MATREPRTQQHHAEREQRNALRGQRVPMYTPRHHACARDTLEPWRGVTLLLHVTFSVVSGVFAAMWTDMFATFYLMFMISAAVSAVIQACVTGAWTDNPPSTAACHATVNVFVGCVHVFVVPATPEKYVAARTALAVCVLTVAVAQHVVTHTLLHHGAGQQRYTVPSPPLSAAAPPPHFTPSPLRVTPSERAGALTQSA